MQLLLPPTLRDHLSIQFLGRNDDFTIEKPAVQLRQVHGKNVIVAHDPQFLKKEADGVITQQKNLPLIIRAADCQNFVVFAPDKQILAAMHVGWRGLLAEIIGEMFSKLKKDFGVNAAEVFVIGGPSLCTTCAEYKDANHELRQNIDLKYVNENFVDLRRAANDQFETCGVKPGHIIQHADCTRCSTEKYFSYRGQAYGSIAPALDPEQAGSGMPFDRLRAPFSDAVASSKGGDRTIVESGVSNFLVCELL